VVVIIRFMETILKLRSDAAHAMLTAALLAACALNLVFVAGFVAARSSAVVSAAELMAGEGIPSEIGSRAVSGAAAVPGSAGWAWRAANGRS
jgi:hypothetical protein